MTVPVRAAAARALAAVLGGRALDDVLADARQRVAPAEQPLLQELAYGAVRHWLRLEPVIRARLKKPLKARDADVHALLVAGAYELGHLRTPAHAAVDAAVDAAGALGKEWARGLVNAILRALERDHSLLQAPADPVQAHAWPQWMADVLASDWPADWPSIAPCGTARAPMTLRVNRRRVSRDRYRELLAQSGLESHAHPHAPMALQLEHPAGVDRLPGFAEGWVSVQDAAAQLAAPLLDVAAGMRVLDACAAPGGKTAHLAELEPAPAEIVALELDPDRAERLRAGLVRLGAEASVTVADAGRPEQWWDGRSFDRILLDAPCSGTGVIRRHPDIKLLRRPGDIGQLAQRQARLLGALWPLLAADGMLLYSTCSIMRRENVEQVRSFLAREASAALRPIEAQWGRDADPGRQLLPGEQDMDGFFYACLQRTA